MTELVYTEGDFKVMIEPAERVKLTQGDRPKPGDKVAVHYRGTFDDGNEFDSSYRREKPFTFELGRNRVIKCWDSAFLHLSKGMKARLHCPAEYAYGSGGAGRIIPPDSDLIFEVELVDINPVEESATRKADDDVSKSRSRRRKPSWRDLPPEGDESSHQCFEPNILKGAFAVFMLTFGYFLYALCSPDQAMTPEQWKILK